MTHLDEGTIHAWLDGAFDARQAADVQAHIDQCAECAAQVAEARGLIAASSRILTALDDVPAGVTPKRAVPPPRRWATRWATGIAAALVLVALWRTTGFERDRRAGLDIDLDRLDSVALINLSMPTMPPMPASQAPPLPAVGQPAVAEQGPQRNQAARLKALAAGMGRGDITATSPTGGGSVGRSVAGAATVAAFESRQDTSAARRLSERIGSAERARDARSAAAESRAEVAKDEAAVEPAWPGCYRVYMPISVAKLEEVVVTSVPAAEREPKLRPLTTKGRAAAGAAAPAPAPAEVAAQKTPAAANAMLLLRLDTTGRASGFPGSSTTRADSVVGMWNAAGPDSVRVRMIGRVPAMLTKRDRVACPE